ncbi:MAG: class I SAM-dependent methyltransferase [Anaerolineales bacterium]|nr:class I SAM-dependent methyltransferase [Anaerolineales bacterium]
MAGFFSRLREWLLVPELRGIDDDDPQLTTLRRELIRKNTFLRKIYRRWYGMLSGALPGSPGAVLELGSGGGFFQDHCPEVISSEIFILPYVDVILDGQSLPFSPASLGGIVMVEVLHHLPDVRAFFFEAARCVRPGGVVTMIEPWITPWSRFVYTHMHKEPFVLDAERWEFPPSGPLSGANGALPWILFQRDRERFEREYPCWEIVALRPLMPFAYLVSGGVSLRQLMPGWAWGPWTLVERLFPPQTWGMFAHVTLQRIER